MLLWSDYMLGTYVYNPYYDNPYYSFWGTSEIRATLNGGQFLSTVSNATTVPSLSENVAVESSWFNQLFNVEERNNIKASKEYETKNWGYSSTAPYFRNAGIVGSGIGQYSTTVLGSKNGAAKYVTTSNSSVIETTSGDNLFLLDYYDLNNLDYGFGENSITTYANKVNSSWTTSSTFYPGYLDKNEATIDCLKALNDVGTYYWARTAGRHSTTTYSSALCVSSNGYVTYGTVNYSHGVRPAFNLNQENIIYATASSVASNGASFAPVTSIIGDKPAYKVYLKADNYVNYNSSASGAPTITNSNGVVRISKTGQSGKAIILLA
ncbi:MAG: hypothetical protein K2P32_01675, partial [Clostridia bacterium]|nr:hypothetical protein [Clostridia bacterium]